MCQDPSILLSQQLHKLTIENESWNYNDPSKLARTIPSPRTSRLVSNCACHSYPRKAEGCRCRLARLHGSVGAVPSHPPNPAHAETCALPNSPAQPWAILFHPPDPPIALQSITWDAPFSQVAMAKSSAPSKLACWFPRGMSSRFDELDRRCEDSLG